MLRVFPARREPVAALPDRGRACVTASCGAQRDPFLVAKAARAFKRLAARPHDRRACRIAKRHGEKDEGD
jgi:hypothetical protein